MGHPVYMYGCICLQIFVYPNGDIYTEASVVDISGTGQLQANPIVAGLRLSVGSSLKGR